MLVAHCLEVVCQGEVSCQAEKMNGLNDNMQRTAPSTLARLYWLKGVSTLQVSGESTTSAREHSCSEASSTVEGADWSLNSTGDGAIRPHLCGSDEASRRGELVRIKVESAAVLSRLSTTKASWRALSQFPLLIQESDIDGRVKADIARQSQRDGPRPAGPAVAWERANHVEGCSI